MRMLLVALIATVAVGAGVAFASGSSTPARSAATDSGDVVRELRKLRSEMKATTRELRTLNRSVGDENSWSAARGTVIYFLHQICKATDSVGTSSTVDCFPL